MSVKPQKSTSFRQNYALRARFERARGPGLPLARRLTGSRCAPAGAAAAGAEAGQSQDHSSI